MFVDVLTFYRYATRRDWISRDALTALSLNELKHTVAPHARHITLSLLSRRVTRSLT